MSSSSLLGLGLLQPAVVLNDKEYFEKIENEDNKKDDLNEEFKNKIENEKIIMNLNENGKEVKKLDIKKNKILDLHMTVADARSVAIFLKNTPGVIHI